MMSINTTACSRIKWHPQIGFVSIVYSPVKLPTSKIHRLKKYRDILGGELWVFFPKFSETAQA